MRSLMLNLLVAFIWLLLQPQPTLRDFAFGFVLGFGLIVLFRPVLSSHGYVRRLGAAAAFAGVFGKAFLLSCVHLIKITLFIPFSRMQPEFIRYDVTGLSRVEILILSHCISLTPGTTTVDVSPDFTHLHLHVLDCPDPEEVRKSIDETLKRGILAFTR